MRWASFTLGFLAKALVIPLAVATGLVLWLSCCVREPWSGFLVNMAAGFVATIMTVFYVDVVLRRHESAQWSAVRARVDSRFEFVANACITSVRTALGVGIESLDRRRASSGSPAERRQVISEFAEKVLPKQLGGVRRVDAEGWRILVRSLQGVSAHSDRLLGQFGPRLEPALMARLLSVQDSIAKVCNPYDIFADFFGVAVDKLPSKLDGSSSIPLQDALYEEAERDLRQLLVECAGFLRALGSTADVDRHQG